MALGNYRRKVDIGKAIKMQARGCSLPEIAEVMGCTPSAVHHALKPIKSMLLNPAQLSEFQQVQADSCDTVAAVYMQELLNVDKIKETKSKDASVIVGIMTEKSRLLRDKSTGNVAIDARVALQMLESMGRIARSME